MEKNFDHLVYLRIFEGCNLRCDHCFIPQNPKKMTLEQISQVPELLDRVIPRGSKVLLQWHGGEPTALGYDFLEQAIRLIEDAPKSFNFTHGIQTNLINYTSQWGELYKKYFKNEVGVSWDFKIRHLKSGDIDSSFARYNERFWENIKKMIADGLEPYMVITFTKELVKKYINPTELFSFLKSNGIKKVHFERLTKTGEAKLNWNELGLTNKEYSRYMNRWIDSYVLWKRGNPDFFCSPFDGLIDSVKNINLKNKGYGCWSGSCDSTFHTIDSSGYKAGCTALNSEQDNKNPVAQKIQWLNFKDFKEISSNRENRQKSCGSCEFKPICSSGCMATLKYDDSGECSGGYLMFEHIAVLVKDEKI